MKYGFRFGSKDFQCHSVGVKKFDGVGIFYGKANRGKTTSF